MKIWMQTFKLTLNVLLVGLFFDALQTDKGDKGIQKSTRMKLGCT